MNNQNSFFEVCFEIKQGNNSVYFNSKQDTISTGQTHTINFDPFTLSYDPNIIRDTYYVKSWTRLLSDSNHYNDTIKSSFTVIDPNYGYSDISGYYFLNSSVKANCT
ncbi:MAG: hypothetical protein IPL53_11415 [Ignavibacteria bacterium]|nr:hypothetical protein [Ignavibacteria bacterium]